VPLNHRAVLFVGVDAYEDAGGVIVRDLFSQDEGHGYITDLALLEQLVMSRLETIAAQVQAEGWKWVQASPRPVSGGFISLFRPLPFTI
jgi:ParB family chromosome partitioning protein